ncbi:hypothetical protein NP493_158g01026 [Ridgeia piscesae]|uniref:EF-hand domain-containing protein n=1 Tax=Ridgeia piscesae TaxID=27915 RepID=A0AAD9UFL5_RIDPI|nr:hypothetical protein NP493_158g01026 [Ridgeia piscesae]
MVEFPEFVDLMSRRPYGFRGSETELTAAFSPFDEYGTGIVNMGALRRALTSLGEPLRDDELDDMLGQAEVDGDGNVEYKGQGRIARGKGPAPKSGSKGKARMRVATSRKRKLPRSPKKLSRRATRSTSILPFREVSSLHTSQSRLAPQYIREPVDPCRIPDALQKPTWGRHQPPARRRAPRLPKLNVDYRKQEEWMRMEYRPVQLARIYRFARECRTDIEEGDMRTWSPQYVKEERAMQTGNTVADMVKAVSLQPAIQSVARRIKELPLNNRPVPETVDIDILGTELKVGLDSTRCRPRGDTTHPRPWGHSTRPHPLGTSACVPTSRRVRQIRLASRAPVLRTIMDSLGSCHVTSTRRHARHVPIYEIDQFDDAHLMCTMRMSIKGKKSNGEKENHSKPQPI